MHQTKTAARKARRAEEERREREEARARSRRRERRITGGLAALAVVGLCVAGWSYLESQRVGWISREATVLGIDSLQFDLHSPGGEHEWGGVRSKTQVYSVVSYAYAGQHYETKLPGARTPGEKIAGLIDPDAPQHFVELGDDRAWRRTLLGLVVGLTSLGLLLVLRGKHRVASSG